MSSRHELQHEDRRVSSAFIRQRFGGVSHMWVERRLKGDPTFPRPIYIARRRFWSLAEITAWERSLATRQSA